MVKCFLFSEYPNCSLKDYLNFLCKKCNKNLCKEHYHHEVSCPFNLNKEEEIKNNNYTKTNTTNLNCAFDKCGIAIYNSIGYDCKLCKLIFCMNHRLECDHDCKNRKKSTNERYIENKNKFKDKLNQLKNKK